MSHQAIVAELLEDTSLRYRAQIWYALGAYNLSAQERDQVITALFNQRARRDRETAQHLRPILKDVLIWNPDVPTELIREYLSPSLGISEFAEAMRKARYEADLNDQQTLSVPELSLRVILGVIKLGRSRGVKNFPALPTVPWLSAHSPLERKTTRGRLSSELSDLVNGAINKLLQAAPSVDVDSAIQILRPFISDDAFGNRFNQLRAIA